MGDKNGQEYSLHERRHRQLSKNYKQNLNIKNIRKKNIIRIVYVSVVLTDNLTTYFLVDTIIAYTRKTEAVERYRACSSISDERHSKNI